LSPILSVPFRHTQATSTSPLFDGTKTQPVSCRHHIKSEIMSRLATQLCSEVEDYVRAASSHKRNAGNLSGQLKGRVIGPRCASQLSAVPISILQAYFQFARKLPGSAEQERGNSTVWERVARAQPRSRTLVRRLPSFYAVTTGTEYRGHGEPQRTAPKTCAPKRPE
jgi:hypothetical protein